MALPRGWCGLPEVPGVPDAGLEALRALAKQCGRRRSCQGRWSRLYALRHWRRATWTSSTRAQRGRFSPTMRSSTRSSQFSSRTSSPSACRAVLADAALLMCSCSLACMKELARCSTMQWRAGPAAAEPAAEKHKQGLAKPRRPDRLAAMLPPDRAAWSTPPLPPSTGIPSSPTTARAAVSSSAVNALQATAMLPAAARRRGRAVARGGTLRLVGPASCVSVCACQAGSAPGRADRRRQRATARGRLTPSVGTPGAESHRRRYRRRTARSSEAATDRARWIGSRNVISTRVLRIFAFSILLCGCVGARVRVSCLSLTPPSLL